MSMKRPSANDRLDRLRSLTTFCGAAWVCLLSRTIPTTHAAEFNIADSDEAALIQAINDANANAEADVINLAAGSIYTLTVEDNTTDGDNALPSITTEITINGNGSIIRRTAAITPEMRLFHVAAAGNLTLNDVELRNGRASDGGNAGADHAGGAILNFGITTINDCTIAQNRSGDAIPGSQDGLPGGNGGAIYNAGTMSIARSTIADNITGNGGSDNANPDGGPGGAGGGIYNAADLTMTQSTIADNTTGFGGGGLQVDGPPGDGGGIYNDGQLTMTACTISGNGAVVDAGGLRNTAQVTLTSCTVANNYRYGAYNTADLDLSNTIVANQASGEDCRLGIAPFSLDYNLDSDGTCMLAEPGDISGGGAMLGPLQDNGGPTETHLPMAGSDAIDAGDTNASATDQRGYARPFDGDGDSAAVSDIGAVEVADCNGDMADDGNPTDSDGDTVPDLCDACPGEDDLLDTDGDGVVDCLDPCPLDAADDSDGDGVCDSDDVCPNGDDTMDTDTDGTPDDCDDCPDDPGKTAPGACGCGTPDTDADGNGTPDCLDTPTTQPAVTECLSGLLSVIPMMLLGCVAMRRNRGRLLGPHGTE